MAERSAAPTLSSTEDPADAAAVSLGVRRGSAGPELLPSATTAVAALGVDAIAALRREDAKGEPGEVVAVPVHGSDRVVLLTGLGDESERALRKAAAAAARRATSGESLGLTWTADRDANAVRAAAESAALAAYRFTVAKEPKPRKLARVVVGGDPQAVRRAAATVEAVRLARDLANTPSLEKSPEWMVEQCRSVAARANLAIDVWDEERLRLDGFGGVLAVGRGSVRPPRLVRLDYRPGGSGRRTHVALVGKGITFDTGGLSLKTPDAMVGMKTDMAGAAAVVAAMSALRELGVDADVTALCPFAENMPGGDATRPSDVIRHFDGRTTEVLNTDAEGRLVLADALAYAVSELRPDVIVDIATLTGAASLGLGRRHGALYATDSSLADALVAAAEAGGERLWPMPLVDSYRDTLDSAVADLRNVADVEDGYYGGSIVAALFLREFVGAATWAHLDVAGPARAESDEDDVTKGATGFGVRTFLRWLESTSAETRH